MEGDGEGDDGDGDGDDGEGDDGAPPVRGWQVQSLCGRDPSHPVAIIFDQELREIQDGCSIMVL